VCLFARLFAAKRNAQLRDFVSPCLAGCESFAYVDWGASCAPCAVPCSVPYEPNVTAAPGPLQGKIKSGVDGSQINRPLEMETGDSEPQAERSDWERGDFRRGHSSHNDNRQTCTHTTIQAERGWRLMELGAWSACGQASGARCRAAADLIAVSWASCPFLRPARLCSRVLSPPCCGH
jgi:hypothetical protein